jgi:peptidoglycan/xylan/chitin deacetylase (PgdA/CDA1 family)
MYHYVRDVSFTRFPQIKALPVELFREQLQYIIKYYTVIKMEDLLAAVTAHEELPENALLLTFDDGFRDHFDFVFPILDEFHVQGSFFPPAKPILESEVLDVHKIQFILASTGNKEQLVNDIFQQIDELRDKYILEENEHYLKTINAISRFDDKATFFIKTILQKGIPEPARNIITDELFDKYVSQDEASFSHELYMNMKDLRIMKDRGMYIGGHGFRHVWLDSLQKEAQEIEISLSLEFLKKIGCDVSNWAMSYPYGGYNNALIEILKMSGCKLAMSDLRTGIANLRQDNIFALPRLDTNDLPMDKNAPPNKWTLK